MTDTVVAPVMVVAAEAEAEAAAATVAAGLAAAAVVAASPSRACGDRDGTGNRDGDLQVEGKVRRGGGEVRGWAAGLLPAVRRRCRTEHTPATARDTCQVIRRPRGGDALVRLCTLAALDQGHEIGQHTCDDARHVLACSQAWQARSWVQRGQAHQFLRAAPTCTRRECQHWEHSALGIWALSAAGTA